MKKAITISIPEPCHEDWGKMTPTEKGKFCKVCTKEVFDFTNTTDEELIKKLDAGKNLCGRFKTTQLDREVKLERKSGKGLLPYAASLLVPLGLLGASEAYAQGGPSLTENEFKSLRIGSQPVKSIVTITGFITDANNVPVSNAEVFVLETGKSVRTAPDGSYKIVCTSGSTLYSIKGELRSEHILLGTQDAQIDMKIEAENIIKTVLTGLIMTTPVIPEEETIEGDIEVQEVENSEENEIIKQLQGKMGCNVSSTQTPPNDELLQVLVMGIVSDSRGPIPGVTVAAKGSDIKTSSQLDGSYQIAVKPNTTLIFSSLGFITREIHVSNISNAINVQLEEEWMGEPQVIVLGRPSIQPDKKPANRKSRSDDNKK